MTLVEQIKALPTIKDEAGAECVSREVVLGLVAERESVLEEVFKHAQALVRLYDDEDASWQAESDVEHSLKEAVKKAAAERQMKRGSGGG